jgi:hypothetical protein
MKKIFSKIDNRHNHVLKTYSLLTLVDIGISYAVGILVATVIIFWAHSITFYTESSYDANDTFQTLQTTEKNRVIESKSYYSELITGLIVIVIFLKLLLRYFALKRVKKTIFNSLEEQGELFFEVMKKNIEITENHSEHKQLISKEDKSLRESKSVENLDYIKLYYEMELDLAKNIEFYDDKLEGKSFDEYAFALFDKEEEDEKILEELQNLVLIFTSPESLADETFRVYISEILQNSHVEEIWILPLVQSDGKYILADKSDEKYPDWRDKIENIIADERVSLYNEK